MQRLWTEVTGHLTAWSLWFKFTLQCGSICVQVLGEMSMDMAWRCQGVVLCILLVGLYQPPMRLGALMLLFGFAHTRKSKCVRPGCGWVMMIP
jgi:hypothetical protein